MVEALEKILAQSSRIVFFGGAGVSTESGIPDFRSVDGLYSQKYDWPPEEILSRTFFDRRPEEFYRFYRDKMLCLDVKRARPLLSSWLSEVVEDCSEAEIKLISDMVVSLKSSLRRLKTLESE